MLRCECHMYRARVLTIATILLSAAELNAAPELAAVSSQPVYPVLIRNDHGPITRVVVTVGKGVNAQGNYFRLLTRRHG